jgi:hypothetical protein
MCTQKPQFAARWDTHAPAPMHKSCPLVQLTPSHMHCISGHTTVKAGWEYGDSSIYSLVDDMDIVRKIKNISETGKKILLSHDRNHSWPELAFALLTGKCIFSLQYSVSLCFILVSLSSLTVSPHVESLPYPYRAMNLRNIDFNPSPVFALYFFLLFLFPFQKTHAAACATCESVLVLQVHHLQC